MAHAQAKYTVIPAQAGIQTCRVRMFFLDPGLRRDGELNNTFSGWVDLIRFAYLREAVFLQLAIQRTLADAQFVGHRTAMPLV